jgi:hypothetical protein
MQSTFEKPMITDNSQLRRVDPWGVVLVLAISVMVGLLYVPLLHWLGRETFHTQQLLNGALLVVLALAICVRDAADRLRFAPQISNEGTRVDPAGVAVSVTGGALAAATAGVSLLCVRGRCCISLWEERSAAIPAGHGRVLRFWSPRGIGAGTGLALAHDGGALRGRVAGHSACR